MIPTYFENDSVIASSIPYWLMKPRIKDIVVFEINKRFYIKRIKEIIENKYFLMGDNKKDSLDSRKFGLVTREQIKAKIIFKL